uniref:Glutamine synthetase n=1 Tax=Jaagichlorella luteoviridis TaxID=31301 RepID=D2WS84_9CHLO|nr:glutamine synthetase II [Jaagichlorella luteoviridis]
MSGEAPKMTFGTQGAIKQFLDGSILERFSKLDQGGKIAAEYIWLGGTMADLRSKTKTLFKVPKSPEDLPDWNYDGSSTDQAPGHDSEVLLKPRAIYKDPFRGGDNILVMCDTYEPPKPEDAEKDIKLKPLPTNTRHACAEAMEKAKDEKPWFGIEQEYTLLNSTTKWPLGWPGNGFPGPQGPYYCSAGSGAAVGREIVEAHLKACYYAGINMSGVNAEVMPAQWEFQVGPCTGIDSGDQLWMARYLLLRLAELYNVDVTFDPKPVPGDWNGAGGHVNFSSESTRKEGTGWDAIQEQIKKLEKKHALHIASYGEGNERRLTGKHETSSMHEFSWGVANRGASIRVGRSVPAAKCGYYEDRRPSSNLDPYVVTKLLVETALLS